MQNRKVLALQIAGAVTLALMFGTSAFAESRHHQGTSRSSGGHIERGGSAPRSGGSYAPRERGAMQSPQRFEPRVSPRSESPRSESRGNINRGGWESRGNVQQGNVQRDVQPRVQQDTRGNVNRDWRGNIDRGNRGYDSRGNVQPRADRGNINRGYDTRGGAVQRGTAQRGAIQRDYRNGNRGNVVIPREAMNDRFHRVEGWHGGNAPYRSHEFVRSYGRVDRIERWHGGYRVWCGGLYPIFVPFGVWGRFPLHVGLFIRFGGYWDPFGYWSVYDYSPWYGGYNDPYYYDRGAYTSGVVHGVVESVDYRRGTIVINDDISRQFVTVTMPRDRRMDDVRPGDYVEFSGDWRGGIFNAYRLDRWDYGRDGGSDRYDDGRDGY